ncbi:hypothetical protein MB27_17250 [Actinoplanes utahensis]|uniref:Uncharacterized protein n=1 Tax=Actinoplanes utahensis TaxID=1869 RepID=A0A0A6X8I8_ACTUT|nr:hypothetical protein MB27_17250 [Actinoplanes utahensis]
MQSGHQDSAQGLDAARCLAFDGAFGNAEQRCHLGYRQVFQVAQHHCGALLWRQAGQGPVQVHRL